MTQVLFPNMSQNKYQNPMYAFVFLSIKSLMLLLLVLLLAQKSETIEKRKLKLSNSCRFKFIAIASQRLCLAVTKNCLLCSDWNYLLCCLFRCDVKSSLGLLCIVITNFFFHLYRIVHVILSTGSNMIRWASKFLCCCRFFFLYRDTTIKTIHFEFNQ